MGHARKRPSALFRIGDANLSFQLLLPRSLRSCCGCVAAVFCFGTGAPIATVATGAYTAGSLYFTCGSLAHRSRTPTVRRPSHLPCRVLLALIAGLIFEGTQRWLRLRAGITRPRLFYMELLSPSVSFKDKRPRSGIDHVRWSLTHDSQESKLNLG